MFLFDHQDILNWCHNKSPTMKNGITIYAAATALGFKKEVVSHLIQTGRIAKVPSNGLQNIDPGSVAVFHDQYITLTKIATGLGTSSTKLMELLKRIGINPVIGPSVDGCRQYFYVKTEVDTVDLAQLIRG